MTSPTALTLRHLRRRGYAADVVERFITIPGKSGIRRDLFRCIDIVAAKPGEPILGVQATSLSNVSARLAKARKVPELAAFLGAGAAFWVVGWALRAGRWQPKIVELRPEDLAPVVVAQPSRQPPRSRYQPGSLFGDTG